MSSVLSRRWSFRWRAGLGLLAGLGACVGVARLFSERYPVRGWLIWDFAQIWTWQLLLSAACISFGHLLLDPLVRTERDPLERLVLDLATGVVVFVVAMYVAGALGIYGATFAVALPVVMLGAGGASVVPLLRRLREAWRVRPASTLLGGAARVFGALGLALLYLQIVTPNAISYDAAWSHLVIAEDFAREGGIVAFPAEFAKNLPHLHSLLYTWGFLVPGLADPALRWMMGLHTEFMLFVWTLVAVVPATRWVLGRVPPPGTFAAFFLFPGFFVADAYLGAGSDHVAAFFALPLFLASVRAVEDLAGLARAAGQGGDQGGDQSGDRDRTRRRPWRMCLLVGLFAGAALHTKYQSIYIVIPALGLLVGFFIAAVVRSWRHRQRDSQGEGHTTRLTATLREAALAVLALFGGTLIGFGPHLLTNWIFYRNPTYPFLSAVFPWTRPALPDLPFLLQHLTLPESLLPPTDLGERLSTSVVVMFTFPFGRVFEWAPRNPVFGFLFSVLVPVALWLGRNRRLLTGLGLALAGVFLWAFTYRVERNLQLVLPWMVPVTVAAMSQAYRAGGFLRAAVVPLVILQVVWGGELMLSASSDRLASTFDLFRGGWLAGPRGLPKRYDPYRYEYRRLAEALPHDAVVLLHTAHLQLGINRRTLSDLAGSQFVIDYRPMTTPRDVHLKLRQLGVTHMVWNGVDYPASKQEDVLFVAYSRRYGLRRPSGSGFTLWELPREAPPPGAVLQVVTVGVDGYRDGLYSVDKLSVFDYMEPRWRQHAAPPDIAADPAVTPSLLGRADAVVKLASKALPADAAAQLVRCFTEEVAYRAGYSIYLRRPIPDCVRSDR